MDISQVQQSFVALGGVLRLDRDVEILVVGGAAGLLLGILPPAWTTADVDVIHFHLPRDRDDVLDAAEEVGRRDGLPPSWMSEDVGLFRWSLPTDWPDRRVRIGQYGRLVVYTVSRLDLIVMKFVAGRSRDLEHLQQFGVTDAERSLVRDMIVRLRHEQPQEESRLARALLYLEAWECDR